jgi:hypothetical protein
MAPAAERGAVRPLFGRITAWGAAGILGILLSLGCAISSLPTAQEWRVLRATLRPSEAGTSEIRWSRRDVFGRDNPGSESQLEWCLYEIASRRPDILGPAREAVDDLLKKSNEGSGSFWRKSRYYTYRWSRVGLSKDGNLALLYMAYGPQGGASYLVYQKTPEGWKEILNVLVWIS